MAPELAQAVKRPVAPPLAGAGPAVAWFGAMRSSIVWAVSSSNFNALLDKADDPKKSIELTLSEMETQIRAARQEVVRSVAGEKQLRKKVEELDVEVEKWSKRAELAVRHEDDDLAREALVQKKRVTAERDRAEALRAEQRSNALEMKAELERMEQKLDEIKAKKGTIVARAQQVKAGGGTEGLGAKPGGGAFADFAGWRTRSKASSSRPGAARGRRSARHGRGRVG
jgi:phage shock protein A